MSNSAISFNTAGLASTTSPGLVGTGAQTFAGKKTLDGGALIKGDTSGVAIASGYVGERQQQLRTATNLNLVSAQFVDLTTSPISLTSGVWVISVGARIDRDAGITQTQTLLFIGTSSGNSSSGLIDGLNAIEQRGSVAGTGAIALMTGPYYVVVPTTTNYYAKGYVTFSGTGNCFVTSASITAIRIA